MLHTTHGLLWKPETACMQVHEFKAGLMHKRNETLGQVCTAGHCQHHACLLQSEWLVGQYSAEGEQPVPRGRLHWLLVRCSRPDPPPRHQLCAWLPPQAPCILMIKCCMLVQGNVIRKSKIKSI